MIKANPNIFHNGIRYVDIQPVFPLEENVLKRCFVSIKKQAWVLGNKNYKDENIDNFDLFEHLSFNLPNSLMAYAIIDNKIEAIDKLLGNKFVDINTTIYNHDRTSELGKPLDIAIRSILNHDDINTAMFLIQQGAFVSNHKKTIEILEEKERVSIMSNKSMAFRLNVLKNYIKLVNNEFSPEYVEKTVALNQLKLIGNQSEEKDLEQAKNILENVDKLSQETLDKVKVLKTKQEINFFEEKLKSLNLSKDLMKNINVDNYSLLIEDDKSIIHYPRKNLSQQFSEKEDWGVFDDLQKLGIHVTPKIKLSEDMIRFLFYQALEETDNLVKNHFNSLTQNNTNEVNKENTKLFDGKENLKNLNQNNVNAYANEIMQLSSKHFEDLTAEQKTQQDLKQKQEENNKNVNNSTNETNLELNSNEKISKKLEEKVDEQMKKKNIFARIFGF